MVDAKSLIYSLYGIGSVQFGEFQLKSGQITPIYINLRKIISYPDILVMVANAIWEKIETKTFDLICGVPYTALPIATCLSLSHQIPMVMSRKEKKDYGTKQRVEGVFKSGQSCIVIEDVITTGDSLLETTAHLEDAGIKVTDVIALIDREQTGRENLEKKYNVITILSLSEILNTLLQSTILPASERLIIEKLDIIKQG